MEDFLPRGKTRAVSGSTPAAYDRLFRVTRGSLMRKGIGKYFVWIVVFLIIFALLLLLVPSFRGGTGVFGAYTPWAVAFLIIYVILMFLVNHRIFFGKKHAR
jgi:hypothetical protein